MKPPRVCVIVALYLLLLGGLAISLIGAVNSEHKVIALGATLAALAGGVMFNWKWPNN